jgi:glycosyltransferase involved in cell wall biosynthesis
MPTISVVIPCYNAGRFLRETLDSVLRQTCAPLEVIVVDDGSTDDSAAIAQSYETPVRVIRQTNQGESVARNRGMDEAQGEWIALLDADDCWEPDKLQKQTAALNADSHPDEAVCVYTDAFAFQGDRRLQDIVRPEWHATPQFRTRMLCNSDATVIPSSALLRADIARQVRFPEQTQHAEDMIFFACLRERGRFLRVAETLTGYRVSAGAQSRAPDFRLSSVQSRHGWFEAHRQDYTREEQLEIRRLLAEELVVAHDMAFWARNHGVVRRCRAYYPLLNGDQATRPPTFRRPLLPVFLLRIKDWWDARRNVTNTNR